MRSSRAGSCSARWSSPCSAPSWPRYGRPPLPPPASTGRGAATASFATFWQLTTDMMVAGSTPAGHGHRYQDELVPASAGVLGLDPAGDYTRIQQAVARDYRPV